MDNSSNSDEPVFDLTATVPALWITDDGIYESGDPALTPEEQALLDAVVDHHIADACADVIANDPALAEAIEKARARRSWWSRLAFWRP